MRKKQLIAAFVLSILLLGAAPVIQSQNHSNLLCIDEQENQVELIVYTAIQEWPSKSWIYILTTQGTPVTSYAYDWFIFNDVEVVNNEVYVTDWVAPRLYKVNISTGDLTVIIDDWSLIYMYDVASDGAFFYIKEWNLNRYTINGVKDSHISFGYSVRGSAWDGTYYWTLLNTSEIKCWDISSWPMITEIADNSFFPPTPACRGLWYDGTYFWTAESIEGTTGFIYQFDNTGVIISQIPEPAPRGYAACLVTMPNEPPQTPDTPQGPDQGDQQVSYSFTTSSIDPDDHDVYYQWEWGDGQPTSWYGPFPSGAIVQQLHSWQNPGSYEIRVRAKDSYGSQSPWSDTHTIIIGNQPPAPPTIIGSLRGRTGVSYLYRFSSIDPEGHMVSYYIDWGDGSTSDWIGPYASGAEIGVRHHWNEQGTYLIKAKAKDIYGVESDWGTIEVTMPKKNHITALSVFLRVLERFPFIIHFFQTLLASEVSDQSVFGNLR